MEELSTDLYILIFQMIWMPTLIKQIMLCLEVLSNFQYFLQQQVKISLSFISQQVHGAKSSIQQLMKILAFKIQEMENS